MSSTTRATVLTIFAALLVCTTAGAGITATTAVAITVNNDEGKSPCVYTHGWRFQALNNIILTTLGTWDEDGDELPAPVNVGIWDDAGNLLDSVTVAVDDPLTDGFRYAGDVLSVNLTKNSYYRIASCVQNDGSAPVLTDRWNYMGNLTLTTASDIDFDSACYDSSEAGYSLSYTDYVVGSSWKGYFGSNFQYVVPEPISLFVLAAGGVFLLRRRA